MNSQQEILKVPSSLVGLIIPEDNLPVTREENISKQSIKSFRIPDYSKCYYNEDFKIWINRISQTGLKSKIDCHLQVDPCHPYIDRVCYQCREPMPFPCIDQRMWVWES